MNKISRKERILYALKKIGIVELSDFGEPHGSAIYSQLYRQLFTDKYNPTIEIVEYICNRFPQISATFLITGEGDWERKTHIVTTTKQEIHVDGGQAAITQSGEAKVEAPKEEPKDPDIATMIRNNDLGGLVAIIMQQKDEIIRLKEQRIHDLETSVRIADANLFPPVK